MKTRECKRLADMTIRALSDLGLDPFLEGEKGYKGYSLFHQLIKLELGWLDESININS